MAEPEGHALSGALARYQLMARIVGTALVLLVLVGMPLKYLAGQPIVVQILGPVHGLLYVVYFVSVLDLARHARLSLVQVFAMLAAGLVPFLTFVVERRVVCRLALPQSGLPG